MKISIYSTQIIPTNPELDEYGGLELIAGLQAKYFDEIGHEVNLFATTESFFNDDDKNNKRCSEKAKLISVGRKGTNPIEAWKSFWDEPLSRQILKDSDIVIDHSWQYYPYSVFNELKHVCKVWHGTDPGFNVKPPFDKPNFIGISFNQSSRMMKLCPETVWRTAYNGIPIYKYSFNPKPISERNRLLWISRIYEPKGTHRAIEIANHLKMPIDIVGGSFGDDQTYTNKIKKMCQDSKYATFIGHVSLQQKIQYYQNAKCVILPIIQKGFETIPVPGWEWHEPFGLVTPEANACGTPVIVSPNGGWMETMIHGLNGFFANTNDEFEYYIKQIDNIKPSDCRKQAERFDYKVMGENYMKLIKEILSGGSW